MVFMFICMTLSLFYLVFSFFLSLGHIISSSSHPKLRIVSNVAASLVRAAWTKSMVVCHREVAGGGGSWLEGE